MAATLDQIDAAIMAALAPLDHANGGPFNLVERWMGDVARSEAGAVSIHGAVLNRSPACLLAFEGEQGRSDFTSTMGISETVGLSRWVVYVVVVDNKQATPVLMGTVGTAGVAGAYAMAGQVHSVLDNLIIDGLLRVNSLQYEGTAPYLVKRGELYVLQLRYSAERAMPDAPTVDTSVPYLGITGSEHLKDTVDPVPATNDPIDTFKTG